MKKSEIIRQAVIRECRKQKISNYKLAQMVKSHIDQSTIYRWLNGSNDLGARKASIVLSRLGLKIKG